MSGLWAFLNDKRNRAVLGWLGGGLAALAIGAWAVFVYVFPPDKGRDTQPAARVESQNGVAAGRNIHARDITIGAKRALARICAKTSHIGEAGLYFKRWVGSADCG